MSRSLPRWPCQLPRPVCPGLFFGWITATTAPLKVRCPGLQAGLRRLDTVPAD